MFIYLFFLLLLFSHSPPQKDKLLCQRAYQAMAQMHNTKSITLENIGEVMEHINKELFSLSLSQFDTNLLLLAIFGLFFSFSFSFFFSFLFFSFLFSFFSHLHLRKNLWSHFRIRICWFVFPPPQKNLFKLPF